jgi:ABC-2 type transport system ATP-binding protein
VNSAISINGVRYRYGDREALAGVTFDVRKAEMFGLLGPNGSGKTTLFRILSTLEPQFEGDIRILGLPLQSEPVAIRRRVGVVFQRPSVDPKLTVLENLRHHGHLYGLRGRRLAERAATLMARLGLAERSKDVVQTLSGGLQRRVELAKGLLHQPALLLLDEPSTGLDPGARRDFIQHLGELRDQDGVTIILTTHYMEEAERCDRVGILHRGRLVSVGKPDALKRELGGDVVVIHPQSATSLRERIRDRFGVEPAMVDGTLRLERQRGHEFVRDLVEAFGNDIKSVSFGKPTLEDVFIHLTGDRFWVPEATEEAA